MVSTILPERVQYRTSQILNSAPDALVVLNEQGIVTDWNQAAVAMFGFAQHEAIGKELRELIIPVQWREVHSHGMRNYIPGSDSNVINHTIEVRACRANGQEFPVELAVKEVTINGGIEFIGMIRDLSDKNRFEENKRESQKMEAIGQLSGGLAHDFNNLLGIVIANLDYLHLGRLESHEARHARNALDAALRASAVTRSLLAVARRQAPEIHPCELNSQIAELTPLIETTAGKHAQLRTTLSSQPLWVALDKTGFSNALINLLINAKDAVKGRVEKQIVLATMEVALGSNSLGLAPGRYAMITVRDNGVGIPESIRTRVFEPFFTTKERGHGTGLGLPMVYGFARQSNGMVQIESVEGEGATVSVYLPLLLSNDFGGEIEARESLKSALHGTLTVLLVEDELFLRSIAARMIADLGFTVLEAESGEEAIDMLRNQPVDILFSDIAMPGRMDGVKLAEWVSATLPEVRIILTTGYLDEQSRLAIALDWQVLDKPYRREELCRVLQVG